MAEDHPHKDIAARLWSAVADGDVDELEQVLAPDVVWRSAGNNRMAGEYQGPAAVLEYLATIGDLTDSFVSRLDAIYVNRDGAVVAHHVTATRGDRTLDMDYLIRLVVRNARISGVLSVPVDQHASNDFWS